MRKIHLFAQVWLLLSIGLISYSCKAQKKTQEGSLKEQNLKKSNQTVNYSENDKVSCSKLDKKGNLWFGTTNEGVYRYDGNSFVNFTELDGLPSNYINCIIEDHNGTMWFGTRNGLGKYDGRSFSEIAIPWDGKNNIWGEICNPNVVISLLEDENKNLWIGTCGGGAFRYSGKTFTNFSFENDWVQSDGLHHNVIQSMVEDADGNIWFTSLTHGTITRFDGKNTRHYSAKDEIHDDMVFASFMDKAGVLWFGSIQTKYAGLYRYDGDEFTSFGKEDGLCDNFVTGFYEDKRGLLWIRTGSVLCLFDGEEFKPFETEDGQGLSDISFIVEDKNANIWMGGRYGHLWKYDGKTLVDFTRKGR